MTDKDPFYRAITVGAGMAVLAWMRTGDGWKTAVVGVLSTLLVMGIEFGWWAAAGERMPATWMRLRQAVLNLLALLPAAQMELRPYDVVFGWYANNPRRPMVGNLKQMKSFTIYGVNGSGKTSLAHSFLHDIILAHTPDQIGLVIIDPKKGVDFDIYERLPHLLWPIATSPEAIKRSLECLQAMMEYRANLFAALPQGRIRNELDRYNYINESEGLGLPPLAPVLVILDEVQRVIKQYKAGPLLEDIATTGRAYGVFIVPITQTPKADALPTEIKSQCYSRFVGKMASARLYGNIAEVPQEIYEEHPLRDHQFFVRFEGGEWQVMTANLVPYEELERVARERSAGCEAPEWPDAAYRNGYRNDTAETAMVPQRAPQSGVIDWAALNSVEEKKSRLKLYLNRFSERPTAADTLEDITWSLRTAETWLPRVWAELEAHR